MKYLIYSLFFFALFARGDELLPVDQEAGEQEAAVEATPASSQEESLGGEFNYTSFTDDNPAPALPPSDTPSIATSSSVSTSTDVSMETNVEAPALAADENLVPVDTTASVPVLIPVPVEVPSYGPSADEGYGSVGLKNQGGILEVGRDANVVPADVKPEAGDRKTSSTEEQTGVESEDSAGTEEYSL